MKGKRIVIKVQHIGYRLFLYELAEGLDIPEFQARNIEKGVEVLVGGADTEKFVDHVRKEKPERAEVREVEVEDYEGKIKPIERFSQSFMLSQMGKFVNIGMEMLETQKGMKSDTGKMLEKQDLMLEKQDETIGEIRGLREDLKSYMEERFNTIEGEIGVIKAKLGMV